MARIEDMHESLLNEESINVKTIIDNVNSIIERQLLNSNVELKIEYPVESQNTFLWPMKFD